MATNNVLIKNAAIAGAASALILGKDISEAGASSSLAAIADAIATEVDSKIPLDEGMSVAKANVCNQVVAAACQGRSFTSETASDYSAIATAIAAVYTDMIDNLE